jgi:pimeloyl-ACP methyl ester carboxylesterase
MTMRERLLAGLPVEERRLQLNGVSTSVLEGGDGPPIVLLHGPGEHGAKWLRVIPSLVTTNRVIAPDLPGHGASEGPSAPLDADRMIEWVDDLTRMHLHPAARAVRAAARRRHCRALRGQAR